MKRIAIVGGGISGLAAAHRISELSPQSQVTLYEATSTLGGALRTTRRDGFLIEHGADMFTTREPWALDLCQRLGIQDELIETNDRYRRAFIIYRGRLVPVPAGFTLMSPTRVWPVLRTPLLSWPAKVRLGCEYFIPRREVDEDESLADFSRRRLGREAYEHLIQPLVGGIYTADPEKLSMQAALPQFVEMERKHGGVIRAVRNSSSRAGKESGARYGSFLAPAGGMGAVVEALRNRIPESALRMDCPVETVVPQADGGWTVVTCSGSSDDYDGLILATPAHAAARLLKDVQAELAGALSQIQCAGAAIIVVAYRRHQVAHPLDGFGCVAPFIERRRILSISFSSVKFAGRAPDDSVLMRVFVGGACQEELLDLSDDALRDLAASELADLLGCQGEPIFSDVVRWQNRMPQYHLGHLQRVEQIEKLLGQLTNFELAGNAYRGVGIPFCVRSGELAAAGLVGVES